MLPTVRLNAVNVLKSTSVDICINNTLTEKWTANTNIIYTIQTLADSRGDAGKLGYILKTKLPILGQITRLLRFKGWRRTGFLMGQSSLENPSLPSLGGLNWTDPNLHCNNQQSRNAFFQNNWTRDPSSTLEADDLK